MANKIITNFSDYIDTLFADAAQIIINNLAENKDDFSGLPEALSDLDTKLVNFNKTRNKPYSTSKSAKTKKARKAVQKVLTKNGNWINTFAEGNLELLKKSGYPLQQPNTAQGILERTVLKIMHMQGTGKAGYSISNLKIQGIHYAIMYTLADNEDNNPANWKFYYCSGRNGIINGLKKGVYKFVSFPMGTEQELRFSLPIEYSVQ